MAAEALRLDRDGYGRIQGTAAPQHRSAVLLFPLNLDAQDRSRAPVGLGPRWPANVAALTLTAVMPFGSIVRKNESGS